MRDKVLETLKKHGGNVTKTAEELGISRATVRKYRDDKAYSSSAASKPNHSSVKSLSDFRNEYDKDTLIPKRIKEGLASLRNGWCYESEFVKLACVSYNDLGNYRDMFSDFIVTLPQKNKRAWAGSKVTAEQMRSMI